MKRLFALILTLTLALSLAGCGSAGSSDGAGESGTSGEESGDPIRVACILSGPISDMSWNYTAHQGLLKMEAMAPRSPIRRMWRTPRCRTASIPTPAMAMT